MPKPRLIPINANNGLFVEIPASIHCRRMEIIEDESVTAQGLDYQLIDDNFATTYDVGTGATQPIIVGNKLAHGNAAGNIIGRPAGSSGGSDWIATVVAKVRSRTATPTSVRVMEYE